MKKNFRGVLMCFILFLVINSIPMDWSYAQETTNDIYLSESTEKTQNRETKILKEEILKRTPNEKHYYLENGSYLAEVYSSDIHYVDSKGKLIDINTNLVDELDAVDKENSISKDVAKKLNQLGIQMKNSSNEIKNARRDTSSFITLETPFAVELPKKFASGYSVSKNNLSIKLVPIDASSHSKALRDIKVNNKLLYRDVWSNTDVELIVTNDGLKENIILKNEGAPKKISFEIIGNVDFESSNQELRLLPTWLIDNKGEYRDVNSTKRVEKGRTYIDLEWDSTGLEFPVIIDPTVTTIRSYTNMFVYSKAPNTNHTPGVLHIGTMKYSVGTYYRYEEYFRSYLNFSLPVNSWSSASIQNAKLKTYYRTSSFPNSSVYIDVLPHHVSGSWNSGMNWNTKPNIISDVTIPTTRINFSTSVNQWIDFDVTNIVKRATENAQTNFTIALVATDTSVLQKEVTVTLESGFMGTPAPVLQITYEDNAAPSPPSKLKINSVSKTTANISWEASIDNSPSILNYEIWSGATVLATTKSNSIDLQGLTENKLYTLSVRAIDDAGHRSATSNIVSLLPGTRPFAYFTNPLSNSENINILNLEWEAFNPLSTELTSIQIMGSKDSWNTIGYDSGILAYNTTKKTSIPNLIGGKWSFKIRAASGNTWGEWISLDDIVVKRKSIYVYDSNGRLDYILVDENSKLDFTYDTNGNLIKSELITLQEN